MNERSTEARATLGRDLLRDLLDREREDAQSQANMLSWVWIAVTLFFLLFSLSFVLAGSNPEWLVGMAERFGAPQFLAQRFELPALAPVLANVSGAIFLNFWRVRRRKLRYILAEALVIDEEYAAARGVLFGTNSSKRRFLSRFRRTKDHNSSGAET
ncbi:MAG: hypothetical protein AAGB25_02515 [Pseudomonadota bacterium]